MSLAYSVTGGMPGFLTYSAAFDSAGHSDVLVLSDRGFQLRDPYFRSAFRLSSPQLICILAPAILAPAILQVVFKCSRPRRSPKDFQIPSLLLEVHCQGDDRSGGLASFYLIPELRSSSLFHDHPSLCHGIIIRDLRVPSGSSYFLRPCGGEDPLSTVF